MLRARSNILPVAVLLAALLPVFVSCQPEEEPDTVKPAISLGMNPATHDAGTQYITLTAGKAWELSLQYTGGQSGWASLAETSGTGSRSNVKLSYTANTSEESRYVTITITTQAGSSSVSLRQYGTAEPKPDTPTPNPDGGYGEDVTTRGWMELPGTVKGDGREFFTHAMTIGGKTVRNYSFDYSYDDFESVWVAYPLNDALIGTYYGRADNQNTLPSWQYDPLLPSDLQQYVLQGYGTGFTRGHQIPSADRQGTYERNVTTFYATNMTPQSYDFNNLIWGNLEGAVRTLAKMADTLYVVTGCVPGRTKTTDRKGSSITLPDAYFKALLYYTSGTSTLAKFSGYSGIAAYLPHDDSIARDSYANYYLTIDQLEKKLKDAGLPLEFFVNLPSDIASKVKAQDKSWLPSSIK